MDFTGGSTTTFLLLPFSASRCYLSFTSKMAAGGISGNDKHAENCTHNSAEIIDEHASVQSVQANSGYSIYIFYLVFNEKIYITVTRNRLHRLHITVIGKSCAACKHSPR